MKGVTNRDRIIVPELGAELKTYWVLADPNFGKDYLVEKILKKHPEFFKGTKGFASIYGDNHWPGCFVWKYDKTIEEQGMDIPIFKDFNYEFSEPLPEGEFGNCGIEGRIFGEESKLLMDKYENNVPSWMKEFAVDVGF
jgi:hypothetical protein